MVGDGIGEMTGAGTEATAVITGAIAGEGIEIRSSKRGGGGADKGGPGAGGVTCGGGEATGSITVQRPPLPWDNIQSDSKRHKIDCYLPGRSPGRGKLSRLRLYFLRTGPLNTVTLHKDPRPVIKEPMSAQIVHENRGQLTRELLGMRHLGKHQICAKTLPDLGLKGKWFELRSRR